MTKIFQDTETYKVKGDDIVLAGGCFDILHQGHEKFLRKAKEQGKILVILLESDENIKKLKGIGRPITNQSTRAENLAKLNIVDYIILLSPPKSSEYYYNLVKLLHPAIIAVTQGDPLMKVKEEQSELVGGKVAIVMKRDNRYSTSALASPKK